MGLAEIRTRVSAQMRGMAIQDKTTNDGTGTHKSPAKVTSVLFKLTSWTRIGVRARFRILDVILNCALLTPLAVLFQVSASGIQDVFFLNHVPGYVGTALLLTIGFLVEFGCSFWQGYLSSIRYVKGRKPDETSYVVATRLYHFAVGFANVCHYRGLSDVYYYVLGYGAQGALQATATTVVLLLSMKCARNVIGAPLCVGVDAGIEDFFQTSTLFRTKDDRYMRHAADHSATVGVVASLCFLHWIAVWAFFDCIIFPQFSALSVVTSWIAGYIIVALAFLLESRATKISRELDAGNQTVKTLFEDVFLMLCNTGVILVWRGHWVFFEGLMYYFPIYHNGADITAFYGLFSSFMMMCLLHASNTLIMKGCDYDGELSDGQGVAFSVDYFATFFHEEIADEEEIEEDEMKRKEEIDKSKQTKAFLQLNNNIQKFSKEKMPPTLRRLSQADKKKKKNT